MKAHALHRLLNSLYNTPHLVTQSTFDTAVTYLNKRNHAQLGEDDGPECAPPEPLFDSQSKIGVLEIHGALSYKPIMGVCGEISGCSYQGLLAETQEMIDAGIKTIIMDIDSGGGEGYSAFESATEIRALCNAAGVKLYAYNDGCMASAAYVFGCIADEVISNPAAETGSIGVLICIANNSKQLEQNGITRTFITAGKEKVPFAADGSFKESFLADLQTKVDTLYEDFVGHVSTYTGLPAEVIKATEAKCFMASDALELGLINKIMTRSEFVDYIATKQKESI